MSRARARDGTRRMDGKLFTFVFETRDKAEARRVAERVRQGDYPCGHASACGDGAGNYGPHYARVVRRNWTDVSFETDDGGTIDCNRWAVFAFPKD